MENDNIYNDENISSLISEVFKNYPNIVINSIPSVINNRNFKCSL